MFLFFWLYGISLFGFIVFMQAFFSQSRVGAITTTFVYFASSFIDAMIADPVVGETTKVGLSFFPTIAVSRGANNLGVLEESTIGLNFANYNDLIDNFRFNSALIMMVVSFFCFTIMGLYLDNVLPSKYGVRKPINFFLTKRYWFGEQRRVGKVDNSSEDEED